MYKHDDRIVIVKIETRPKDTVILTSYSRDEDVEKVYRSIDNYPYSNEYSSEEM